MPATRICIVRHGETDWNAEKRLQGQIDIPLNAVGHAQAAAAAAGLRGHGFDVIYSSDMARTRQTAAPIAAALGLPVFEAAGLRERHYGLMQGRTAEESRQCHPEIYERYVARDPDADLGGGESLRAFAARVEGTLATLVAAHPGRRLLMVSHGGVLDIVYRLATGRDLATPRDFLIPNAALNWIELVAGTWRLVAWGDRAHLAEAMDEVAG